jgi:hypothetical protein
MNYNAGFVFLAWVFGGLSFIYLIGYYAEFSDRRDSRTLITGSILAALATICGYLAVIGVGK